MAKAKSENFPPPPDYLPPEERFNLVGHLESERRLLKLIEGGDLSNGWIIVGGEGVGKATLAFRAARALLGAPLKHDGRLHSSADDKINRLISANAHPDVFVARRAWQEKTQKFATEITVDQIRDLNAFLLRTAAMGDWRVAIIDSADELNRNAANALLKILEEPPARTTLLLLSAAPGRLLPTIRSRCRRIVLQPVADQDVASFLEVECGADPVEADSLAAAAHGRPGYALRLAKGGGATAVALVDAIMRGADGRTSGDIAQGLQGKAGDIAWPMFRSILIERLSGRVSEAAKAADHARVESGLRAMDEASDLLGRSDALNLDRSQVIHALLRIVAA